MALERGGLGVESLEPGIECTWGYNFKFKVLLEVKIIFQAVINTWYCG